MSVTSLSPNPYRIISLDILRGIAVLGIIILNIQAYSMSSAISINPSALGDLSGINKKIWMLSHVLVEQKFMTIFSMLFGAGIILFAENIEQKGYRPARFHYRRLFWLFTSGLIHAYLFWHGDVLVIYAISGALAYLFRRLSPWVLLPVGIIIFSIPSFNYWLFGTSMEMWPEEVVNTINETWAPSQEAIDTETRALTGSLGEQLTWRIPAAFKMQTFFSTIWYGWRIFAMMLIGMSFFQLGILSGNMSKKFYLILTIIALPLGILLIMVGVKNNFAAGWSVEYSMFFGWQWNYIGSLFVAIAYIAIVMFLGKVLSMGLFAKVGKLAFTNYLLTTLICTTLFYGHGFGLFGSLDRSYQMIVVLAIWAVLLTFSHFWLKRFYYGPVEWLWRYLTYGNKPDFKK